MNISKIIDDIRHIEESDEYKHHYPDTLRRKEILDEKITKFIWE